MKKADVLIIGGSAAGLVAGISCRRRHPDKQVALIRKEEQVLVPCAIPYIFGTLDSPEKDLIPDALLSNNGIELIKGEAVSIDRNQKVVSTADGDTVGYDKLILATGSLPIRLPIRGSEKQNVFVVSKDIVYLKGMLEAIEAARDIVIIGGGFIGVEFADECKKNRDANVSIVETLPHCLQLALDTEFCIEAESTLVERGIRLFTDRKVEAILGDTKVTGVKLSSGEELKADVVIMGVGAIPNVELAKNAGLQIGPTKAIQVDNYMRTLADPDVFACGDAAEKRSFFTGKCSAIMLASVATAEARIAGANVFNTCCRNSGEIGVWSTIVGERAFGCAGLTEMAAIRDGFAVVTGESTTVDRHPGAMPGAASTKVKLVFCKESGLLLGGGVSGGRSVGELVNVISACVQHSMTAHEVSLFQMGTHPALTASPIAYQLVNAAELAVAKL
ncbi:MAG: NAD(P)/FAD-dependent oxidoreductase [Dehalococcoidia bacterium]|nr:NAD(P)/FAD-dependent oxidoreductase [Dehalococcoidia bacterium]